MLLSARPIDDHRFRAGALVLVGALLLVALLLDLWFASAARGAVAAALDVGDEAIDFGDVARGTSSEQVIVVRNVGDGSVLIHGIDLRTERGAFALVRDGCTRTSLDPGAQCEVAVMFAPAVAGSFDGALVAAAEIDDPPSVALRGTGTRVDDPVEPGRDGRPDDGPSDDAAVSPGTPGGGTELDDLSIAGSPAGTRPDPIVVAGALAIAVIVGTLPLTVPDHGPHWVRRHLSVRVRRPVAARPDVDDGGRQARTVRLAPRPGSGTQYIEEES